MFVLSDALHMKFFGSKNAKDNTLTEAQGKRRIQVASNILKIGATKSRLHSSVVANVEPVSILFHKFHFIKTRQ